MLNRQHGYSLIDVLVVVGIISVASAVAVPMTGSALSGQRFKGDAQALSNVVGLAKMRASAGFTRARVRANVGDRTFQLEVWDKAAARWVADGGTETLYREVRFGFGALTTPPPGTQDEIAMSPPCRVGLDGTSAEIGNTSCVVFNSRGLPIGGDGLLAGGHALYMTDGAMVYATTVTATPRLRLWSSRASTATWMEQQ